MTQNTQNTQTTTIERIATLIDARIGTLTNQHSIDTVARIIAAEIDALTAEVERLRPAAEAWEAMGAYQAACVAWDLGNMPADDFMKEHDKYRAAVARAREAAKGAA